VRLHEKGGKRHEMPCHHNLDEYLHAYINSEADRGQKFLIPHDTRPHWSIIPSGEAYAAKADPTAPIVDSFTIWACTLTINNEF
jgi:hypothetical protein